MPLYVYAMLGGLQHKKRSKINETAITNLNLPIDLEKVGDSKLVITKGRVALVDKIVFVVTKFQTNICFR